MLLVGRALDRWGLRVAAGVIALLGLAGAGLALAARDLIEPQRGPRRSRAPPAARRTWR